MATYIKFELAEMLSKIAKRENISIKYISFILLSSFVLMISVHCECYDFDNPPYGEWAPCGDDEGYEVDQGFLILSPTDCLGVSSICKNLDGPTNINFWWKHVGGELTFWVDERPYRCRNSTGESRTIPIVEDGPHTIKWKFAKGGLGQSASIDYICIGDNHKGADLLVTKTDSPDPVIAGGYLTYIITVINNGPSDATGITVKDKLPTGLTYFSNSTTQGSYNSNTGIWAVGNLAKGASSTLNMTVYVDSSIPDGSVIFSQVDVVGTEPDSNQDDNHAEAGTLVNLDNYNPVTKIDGNLTTYADINRDPDRDAYIYNSINEAIGHVQIGGIVRVANGTYIENIIINKSLRLISDYGPATIIQGAKIDSDVVHITANDVVVKGFTIRNGECGIHVYTGSNCTITDNLISSCSYGIIIDLGDFSHIINNTIYNTTENPGIDLYKSSNCTLSDNCIFNSNIASIYFEAGSNDSLIERNLLSKSSGDAIIFIQSNNNSIQGDNTFDDIKCCDVYEHDNTCLGNIMPKNCIEDIGNPGCFDCTNKSRD